MIKVIFKPYGHLYRYFPVGSSKIPHASLDVFNDETKITVQAPPGTSLKNLYEEFGLTGNEYVTSVVNGKQESNEYVLQDGDLVEIIPAISGG